LRGVKRTFLLVAALCCGGATVVKAVKIVHNSSILEFSFEWPRQAAAIPALDSRMRSEMARAYRESLSTARKDSKMYREQQRTGISDFYSMAWTTAGETPRLLSLESELSTFTGGAHPNTSYGSLLWDRKLGRPVSIDSLLIVRSQFAAVTRAAYCSALGRERNKRRQGEKLGLPEFNACPKYADLAIAPMDKNGNGRFDTIDFVASPYIAGPYSEGEYAIEVSVTKPLLNALRPEYRSSFESQRRQ
jgi:hypothetical protein